MSTALADLGRRHLRGLFIQPPDGAEDISAHLLRLGFRPAVAGIAPAASIRIDLTRDVEDIRNGLASNNRPGVCLAALGGSPVLVDHASEESMVPGGTRQEQVATAMLYVAIGVAVILLLSGVVRTAVQPAHGRPQPRPEC